MGLRVFRPQIIYNFCILRDVNMDESSGFEAFTSNLLAVIT